MSCKWDIIGREGLQFFGKMTASISHDIKNVLAIINENVGLLQDLCLMVDKGKALEPERVKTIAGNVIRQIQRADEIIRNMNQFAHSADEPVKSMDLGEILDIMKVLGTRFAAGRGVKLESKNLLGPVKIKTNPFFLENLIWLCINFAIDLTGKDKIIELISKETESGGEIRIKQIEGLTEEIMDSFPSEKEQALFNLLNAELTVNVNSGELIINLPKDIRV